MYGCFGSSNTSTGVALLDDLAGVHHADPVAHRADHAEVVGDEQDRGVGLVAQGAHEVEHLGLDGGVETGGRLVEHEQLRVARQRHGDHDALLHPAGELVRIALHDPHRVGDAHAAQRLEGVLLRLACGRDRGRVKPRRPGGRSSTIGFNAGPGSWYTIDAVAGRGTGAARVSDIRVTSSPPTRMRPPVITRVRRQVAQRGVGGGRLAAPRLADQPVRLARGGRGTTRPGAPPAGCRARGRRAGGRRPRGRASSCGGDRVAHAAHTASIESAIRLMAITRLAMASAGKIVGHHCRSG